MGLPLRSYRDLRAWQEGMLLVSDAYQVIRSLVPEERFTLGDQMRKAAKSVVLNIAEGHGRPRPAGSRGDYRRFLGFALASLDELENQLLIALRERLAPERLVRPALKRASNVRVLLRGLYNALKDTD